MKENKEKRQYLPPGLTVAEFRTERGFASTGGGGTNNTENRQDGGIITNGADNDGWF